jgi:PAS domain S-box-containing protein
MGTVTPRDDRQALLSRIRDLIAETPDADSAVRGIRDLLGNEVPTDGARLQRLTTAIQNVPVIVKVLSPDWRIEFVNPVVESVLGYTPDQLVGRPISFVREGDDAADAAIAAALERGATWSGDRVDRHRDGHSVPVRLVVAGVRKPSGALDAIVEIARDLTEEHEQEIRAKDAYRMSAVGELAAAVAHEVNNPLAAITMMTRVMLADDALPPALRRDLEIINAEAHRAGSISRNLLSFARPCDTHKEVTSLEPVVREVVRLKLPELRLASIDVDIVVPTGVPCAIVNPGQIRQVLHNLVSNSAQAIQEAKERGNIRVSLAPAGEEWLELVVEDDGTGIPEHLLERVTRPFFTTKPRGRGTGLGLSVTSDIVREHGGDMVVANRPEGGTSVTIRLPATSCEVESVDTRNDRRRDKSLAKARLLIVDDDIAVSSTLKRLVAHLGHDCEVEHRAESAIARLSRGDTFDAILSDIKMPGIGGEGVFRSVQLHRPELINRLIFMSGDLTPEADNDFLSEANCPTLSKPFTLEQLSDSIATVLED